MPTYKTRDEAIEAAKILLELDGAGEDVAIETDKESESGHVDSPDCWCCPERIEASGGVIYVHRQPQ